MTSLRIGIDIGGTFTDFVIYSPASGSIRTMKLRSTPQDPAAAVLQGLHSLLEPGKEAAIEIIHGSTVATNALLERKGARTALITTRGFHDVLRIGRQNRPSLYDLAFQPPEPLVPDDLRLEVDERVDHNGNVRTPLDPAQLEQVLSGLQQTGCESVAVCLLFSFLQPAHEEMIAARLKPEGYSISLSSEVLPEYREYERTSTTVINVYVSPVLDRYLSHLETGLAQIPQPTPVSLRVMQSNGGAISPQDARKKGVHCILSGPAGGVIGSQYVAGLAVHPPGQSLKLITFDMGGTSTDISLIDGAPKITTESLISGLPVRVPLLDIHTIGAGGGSIAQVDAGGALRVGPQSAGAEPGPACYGIGDQPTVTDANLVLGRLVPDFFLGGKIPLDLPRAQNALRTLGSVLELDPIQAALGVIEVVNAHMERALRVTSVERGYDPGDFTLLSFGGAGGLHACELAQRLGIRKVLIPPHASVLSALGMLVADVIKDYSVTVMLPGDTPLPSLDAALQPLIDRGKRELESDGFSPEKIQVIPLLDMRYRGQSYELIIPYSPDFRDLFHAAHLREYGYRRDEAPIEIVNLRARLIGPVTPPQLPRRPEGNPSPEAARMALREVAFQDRSFRIPFYSGEKLLPGNRFTGPAEILRSDTTILIPEGTTGRVDSYGNLLLDLES